MIVTAKKTQHTLSKSNMACNVLVQRTNCYKTFTDHNINFGGPHMLIFNLQLMEVFQPELPSLVHLAMSA
jgi:hypothetical protein